MCILVSMDSCCVEAVHMTLAPVSPAASDLPCMMQLAASVQPVD